jgi:hypothetical protein
MRYLVGFLLLASTLASAASLHTQEIRSPYRFVDESHSLGVYGGFLVTDAGSPATGPQSAPIFGVRYNLRFTGPLSGEAAVSLVPTRRDVLFQDTVAAEYDPQPVGDATMNLLIAEAGIRFHFTGPRAWRGFAPYALATGGLAADLTGRGELDETVPEVQRFRFGPSFAVGIGLGTDLFLTDRLSLRLEARNHVFRLARPVGLRDVGQAEHQWTNNLGLTLGTSIHF